jgi:DUF1009 family protein
LPKTIKRIGLIAGNGKFPLLLANVARSKGVSVVAVALREETDPALERCVDTIHWISVGELRRLLDIFKAEGIKKAIMAGKITKARLFKNTPHLDGTSQTLLENAKDKKDTSLLKSVTRVLRFFGIRLIDSTYFLKDHLPQRGLLSHRQPTPAEWQDIRFGYALAKKMGRLDIGQTVVVKSKAILAIEAIEGTDEAIQRGGKLGNGEVVVVKTARPRQDKRFDVPTVGPETLHALKEAGGNVLAIEARKTLLLEREECVNVADAHDLSLVVI